MLVGSGWILSALHQLNRVGYGLSFAVIILFRWRKAGLLTSGNLHRCGHKFLKRFRRRALGIHYVVLNGPFVNQTFGNIGNWLKRNDGSVADQYSFPKPDHQPADPPDLYIVRLS
ncbi:MAG TPA: hypothetical protein VH251_03560 [Verrucomicrobiae bacterium]|nr:hypothetical protein [Verrucomicrobiae bacterium]